MSGTVSGTVDHKCYPDAAVGLRTERRGDFVVPVYTFRCGACGTTWDEDYSAGALPAAEWDVPAEPSTEERR